MLTAIFSGAMLGLLMASVFITGSMLTMFFLVKNTPPHIESIFRQYRPDRLAMVIVIVAYPFWTIVGGILAMMYRISAEQAPGAGIGSPNLVFTLFVIVVTLMFAIPAALLLRQVVLGVISLALLFLGIFGWFMPYFLA